MQESQGSYFDVQIFPTVVYSQDEIILSKKKKPRSFNKRKTVDSTFLVEFKFSTCFHVCFPKLNGKLL